MGRIIIILALWLAAFSSADARPQDDNSHFSDWSAAIIAADWKDSQGRPIDAFDNARRDLAQGFLNAGFRRENMVDVALSPRAESPRPSLVLEQIGANTARHTAGCLLYFTSHGSPEGMVFGGGEITPERMNILVRSWCGSRPTVVIVSACYSGVFVGGLAGPNRMILTAARRDRSSFGCGANETYPWFDGCVLENLPDASDFIDLAARTRACVAAREAEMAVGHPSEPQLSIGAGMQLLLPTLRFNQSG